MKKLTFTGAFVRHVAIAISAKDGAKTVRADWTMQWMSPIRKTLGFSDLEDDQENVALNGELAIHEASLSSGGQDYKLGSGILGSFRAVRVDDGKKPRVELRAQYTITGQNGIAGVFERYIEKSGRAKGELSIEFDFVEAPDEMKKGAGEQGTLVDMT